jgi:hypothetical protein
MSKRTLWITLLILCLSALGLAQDDDNNELGLTLGAELVPEQQLAAPSTAKLTFSKSVVFGANYARRLTQSEGAALYLEFPFTAAPSHRITSANPAAISNLATLFVTPSLRLKFAPAAAISPWISGGFGYGLLEGDQELPSGARNPEQHKHTAAAQFGGGVDMRTPLRILKPISLRAEFRDFYTLNTLHYNLPLGSDRQHHLVVAGGFVLRF